MLQPLISTFQPKNIKHVINDERGFGGTYEEYRIRKKLPANSLKKLTELKEPGSWTVIEGETI
jgi:hypothetical protein